MASREQLSLALTVIVIPILWRLGGTALRRYFTRRYTVAYDIPQVAFERGEGKRIKGTAVICGGSIAGLLSARICANHFEDVLIIEPEAWTNTEDATLPVYDEKGNIIDPARFHKRTRVVQYESIHTFLPVILNVVKVLFPGFAETLVKADARVLRNAMYIQHRDGRVFREGADFEVIFASRDLFERVLRKEVMKCKRIKQVVGTATGVSPSLRDLCRLENVHARLDDGSEAVYPAALVVDCTGPTQAGYKWLKRLFGDVNAPPQISNSIPFEDLRIEYNANIVSTKWRAPVTPDMRPRMPMPHGYDKCGWVYSYLGVLGKDFQSLFVQRVEGHRFEITFTQRAEPDYEPPKKPEELLPLVKNLSHLHKVPEWVIGMLEILLEKKDEWEDLSPDGRLPFSCVRFDRAPFLPHNFVAIGDSWMRLNPINGQGLSKAVVSAVILDSLLRAKDARNGIPDGFGRRFADEHERKMGDIWNDGKNIDYQWPTTIPCKGEKLGDAEKAGKIVDFMMELVVKDDFVDEQVAGIRAFLRPPTDMLHPKMLMKLSWLMLQKKFGLA